jgi:hypothetical protein
VIWASRLLVQCRVQWGVGEGEEGEGERGGCKVSKESLNMEMAYGSFAGGSKINL